MQEPNEAITNHIECLPSELVAHIMFAMTLKDRMNFIEAYPIYQSLASSPILGTRVISCCDKDLKMSDFSELLDLDGTEITIQGLSLNIFLFEKDIFQNFELFQLMPNLESIVLKDCKLFPGEYAFLLGAVYECMLRQFPTGKYWKLLSSRVKYLTIDNYHSGGFLNMDDGNWKYMFQKHFLSFWQDTSLQEVVIKNTLTLPDFEFLVLNRSFF